MYDEGLMSDYIGVVINFKSFACIKREWLGEKSYEINASIKMYYH